MAYSQRKLNEVKAAAAAAGSCVVEEIQACNKWKAPAYFSCTSGVLLWGQLNTIMQGHLEKKLDKPLTNRPAVNEWGMILSPSLRYRAPARKGVWKVEALFTGKPDRPVGYICHHIDLDGHDLLRRAAVVGRGWSGVSPHNDHTDRDIVHIDRSAWSNFGCRNDGCKLMTKLLKPDSSELQTS